VVITSTPLLIYFCIIPFSLINSCFTIPPLSSSDHKVLLVSLHNDVAILSNSSRTVWCYSQENFDLAWTYVLNESDWNSMFSNASNVNQLWSTWQKRFLEIMELKLVSKTTSLKKCLPWLSPSLLSAMKKEKLSFQINQKHWLGQWISRIQEAKNLGTTTIRHTKTSFRP